MSGKTDAARAALRNVEHLHPVHVEPIIKALDAAGLLDSPKGNDFGAVRAARAAPRGSRLSPLRTPAQAIADNIENAVAIKQIVATAKRIANFEIKPDEIVDPVALDKALVGKDVDARMGLKLNMARLALIP
jgi:hypothetical protein